MKRKKKSKRQLELENVWWRKVVRKCTGKWKLMLDCIECKQMRSKVASVIWWDIVDKNHESDISELKKVMRSYSYVLASQDTAMFDKELSLHLKSFGYPTALSITRAKKPKNNDRSRSRRNKK